MTYCVPSGTLNPTPPGGLVIRSQQNVEASAANLYSGFVKCKPAMTYLNDAIKIK